jgi:hypothetical protein
LHDFRGDRWTQLLDNVGPQAIDEPVDQYDMQTNNDADADQSSLRVLALLGVVHAAHSFIKSCLL